MWILFFSPFSFAFAQTQDSTDISKNNIILDTNNAVLDTGNAVLEAENMITDSAKSKTKVHSTKKAAWMSTALPGLGQAYNKKYWKIPAIYVGLGGAGCAITYFAMEYVQLRDEYRNRLNEKTDLYKAKFENFQTENINAMRQDNQRYMELAIIFTAVGYLFNILDAAVDAHLMGFNVSDDLSLNILPSITLNNSLLTYTNKPLPTINITFTLNFK